MSDTSSKPKVLIVDDETINIQFIGNVLRDYADVIFATNGKDALMIAKANSPDIILLDIVMPDMDGYEVCKKLKEDSDTGHIPIIFVTAESSSEDEARGLSLGAIDFVTKPFNPDVLTAKVKNNLEQQRSRPPRGRRASDSTQAPAEKPGSSTMIAAGVIAGALIVAGVVGYKFMGGAGTDTPETAQSSSIKTPAPTSEASTSSTKPTPEEDGDAVEMSRVVWAKTSKCDTLPQVAWWKNQTHVKVALYVNRRHKGDWDVYADKWSSQHVKLQNIYAKGSVAIVPGGRRLAGKELYEYIQKVRQRVEVIGCLSKEAASNK